MTPDIYYMPVLTWLAIGAVTGWISAPLMRLHGVMILFSIAVGMAGALPGGVLITLLKSATGGDATGSGPGTLLFVFACAGMMLATVPRSRHGTRHQKVQPDSDLHEFPRQPRKV